MSGRLLVVDDDDANREMLARRLARHGFEVVTASNGLDALQLVRTSKFDLVLLTPDLNRTSPPEEAADALALLGWQMDLDESDVEELHGFLEKAEIELVEDIDPATAASHSSSARRTGAGGAKPPKRSST